MYQTKAGRRLRRKAILAERKRGGKLLWLIVEHVEVKLLRSLPGIRVV